MKKEYLKKINELYKEIRDIQSLGKNPGSLDYLVKQVLEQITKLNEIDKSMNYSAMYHELNHTLGKEVYYVNLSYKKATKKNAAKVRQKEYEKELNNAIKQIHIDIFEVLEKND